MKTINNEIYTYNWEIKRSKFLTYIGKITSKEELHLFLEKYQQLDATHNCYAYKFGIEQINGGYHDDGEPTGSAGLPIFKVIESNDLTNIVILVIRYYGGIKLGQGPLTRAYGQSASQCLKTINLVEIQKLWSTEISFPLKNIKKVDYYCLKNNLKIVEKNFGDQVSYSLTSNQEVLENQLFTINRKKSYYQ